MPVAQRIVIVVLVVAVAAVGFVLLQPDDEDDTRATTTSAPAQTAPAATPAERPIRRVRTAPAPPPVPRIVVRGGEPVGGVRELELRKGQTLRFVVVSDAPDEVHLHGYDVELPVAPGRPARFELPADIEGIFEVELHHGGGQIASVTVEP